MMPWADIKALSNMLDDAQKQQHDREVQEEVERLLETPKPPAKPTKPRIDPEVAQELEELKRDRRKKPEYEFLYKQDVSSNDVYLQLSDKDPGSLSCEHLVMRVKLPETEAMGDLSLDLKPTYMKLLSPIYAMGMFLPYSIIPDKSNAKWDYEASTLEITMHIDRQENFD